MKFRLEATKASKWFSGISIGFLLGGVLAAHAIECNLVALWFLILAGINCKLVLESPAKIDGNGANFVFNIHAKQHITVPPQEQ